MKTVEELNDAVRDLEMVVWGVDKNNGLRSEMKTIIKEQVEIRKEIRDVTNFQTKILGGILVIAFLAQTVLSHIWK